ncbi:hypothetical protein RCL1_006181 [Eukaryota sp. TZLM3-RCL]
MPPPRLPSGTPGCLRNLSFCVAGDFDTYSATDIKSYLKSLGARVVATPAATVQYCVIGRNVPEGIRNLINRYGTNTVLLDGLGNIVQSKSSQDLNEQLSFSSQSQSSQPLPSLSSLKPKPVLLKKSGPLQPAKPLVSATNLLSPPRSQSLSQGLPKLPTLIPSSSTSSSTLLTTDSSVWTEKYRPQRLRDVIGNPSLIKSLKEWLQSFATEEHKLALLHGSPGIGKTTTASLVVKELGMDPIEYNASDARSKNLIDESISELITSSYSLTGLVQNSKSREKSKPVLIMDEVDGMSIGDRGGLAHLLKLSKKTKIPIICIANDVSDPKFKTLKNYSKNFKFQSPSTDQFVERLTTICRQEGITASRDALIKLIEQSNFDIRYALTSLQVLCKTPSKSISFLDIVDKVDTKEINKNPFTVIPSFFEPIPSSLSSSSRHRPWIYERMNNFYLDDLVPLMVQENYIWVNKPDMTMPDVDFFDKITTASASFSQSDLIESSIREFQQWSLLPAKGFLSTVYPGATLGGRLNRTDFPAFLGKLSKRNKFARLLSNISLNAFPCTLSSSTQFSLYYAQNIQKIVSNYLSNSNVDQAIEFLTKYSIDRDDWTFLFEEFIFENFTVLPSILPKTKAALTRKFKSLGIDNTFSNVVTKTSVASTAVVEEEDEEEEEEKEEKEAPKPVEKRPKSSAKPRGTRRGGRGGTKRSKTDS